MSDVIQFPKPPAPAATRARYSGKQVWQLRDRLRSEHGEQSNAIDAKIHAVCGYLKSWEQIVAEDERPIGCLHCPQWEDDERHGTCQRACYGIAEEFVALAMYGETAEPELKR